MRNPIESWNTDLSTRYGRKQGLVRHLAARTLHSLGGFRSYRAVDWPAVDRLVFVCTGNICRSPYAEKRALRMGIPSTSFGLQATPGRAANPVAAWVARERGIELFEHRSQSAAEVDLKRTDLLVGMEPIHATRLLYFARQSGSQVTLLGLWCSPTRPHIEDPYGLSEAYFETCFACIDAAVAGLAHRLASASGLKSPGLIHATP